MISSAPSSQNQSKVPTYSGFFQMHIRQKGTETRVPKLVYFNTQRGCFYSAEVGDSEQKFRGPESGLTVIGVVSGSAISFPGNREYEAAETLSPMNGSVDGVLSRTHTGLEGALAGTKSIY